MNFNLVLALPEIFLTLMIVIMLLVDAFSCPNKKHLNTVLTFLTLVGGFILQILVFRPELSVFAFNNMFILDALAEISKLFIYLFSIVIFMYIKHYINDKKVLKGEFYAIFLFAILGMQVMVSAANFLVLYVGLELLSLSLIGLVAINRDSVKATEAAMKYFILSALASGILLYGISYIYGATGQLQLREITLVTYSMGGENNTMLLFGLVFVIAGLVFKLGLVPFHMWVPDVYEGSSLPTLTIIGTISKIAGIVFMIRILFTGLILLNKEWVLMLQILAVLSLFIGNIVAIAQTNIKRMLGYSAIAHMGFVALGIMTISSSGLAAVIFYMIVYVITSLAGFGVLLLLSKDGFECEKISDLSGLSKAHPIYAGIMLVVMFSLAGIPPLAGFYAKFLILKALVDHGFIITAIYAVILSLIGAFYYLRVVKVMYFDEKDANLQVAQVTMATRTLLFINGSLIVLIGIAPKFLMYICSILGAN
jgi:NADH-quinone oxidoreductase subunit N